MTQQRTDLDPMHGPFSTHPTAAYEAVVDSNGDAIAFICQSWHAKERAKRIADALNIQSAARKPLSEDDALELVSLHQKAVFELAKDMSDDNYQIVVQTRLALLNALRPGRAHGIVLEVNHADQA